MTDEQKAAERNYRAALKRVTETSGKSAPGAERAYGLAYQQMVRLNMAQQIKAKYRHV